MATFDFVIVLMVPCAHSPGKPREDGEGAMSLTLVILAAGIGSRYGGLKQMEAVGPSGEFIIDYAVFDAMRAGFDRMVMVIRRDIAELFRETIGRRLERRVAVEYVCQELSAVPPGFRVPPERQKPWGTGHALLTAAPLVGGPHGVVNADDFYGRRSYEVLARFLEQTAADESRAAMVGFILRNTLSAHGSVARGICAARADGTLETVVERTKIEPTAGGARYLGEDGQWHPLTGEELASMNMWGFKPPFFRALESEFAAFLKEHGQNPKAEYFIPTVVNTLISRGRLTTDVLQTPEVWCGVTYPDEKAVVVSRVRDLIRAGLYPDNLWA
jgi:UTP-glucose-1-phosphate uridylyltransferase